MCSVLVPFQRWRVARTMILKYSKDLQLCKRHWTDPSAFKFIGRLATSLSACSIRRRLAANQGCRMAVCLYLLPVRPLGNPHINFVSVTGGTALHRFHQVCAGPRGRSEDTVDDLAFLAGEPPKFNSAVLREHHFRASRSRNRS